MSEGRYSLRRKPEAPSSDDGSGLTKLLEAMAGCSKLIVVSGSGLSASSGMSTFSTRGGLYERAQKRFGLSDGKKLFCYSFFDKQRQEVQPFFAEIYREACAAKPAPGHHAIAAVHAAGKLLRHYTLNIDGLAAAVGMGTWHPDDNPDGITVEMHGSIQQLVCPECSKVSEISVRLLRRLVGKQRLACGSCKEGVLRWRVMMYDDAEGEAITPDGVFEVLEEDCAVADGIIWVGLSFEQSATTAYFRRVRAALTGEARLHLVPQFVVNPSDEALWNLMSSCCNQGDLQVTGVLASSDDVLPQVAAAMTHGLHSLQLPPPQPHNAPPGSGSATAPVHNGSGARVAAAATQAGPSSRHQGHRGHQAGPSSGAAGGDGAAQTSSDGNDDRPSFSGRGGAHAAGRAQSSGGKGGRVRGRGSGGGGGSSVGGRGQRRGEQIPPQGWGARGKRSARRRAALCGDGPPPGSGNGSGGLLTWRQAAVVAASGQGDAAVVVGGGLRAEAAVPPQPCVPPALPALLPGATALEVLQSSPAMVTALLAAQAAAQPAAVALALLQANPAANLAVQALLPASWPAVLHGSGPLLPTATAAALSMQASAACQPAATAAPLHLPSASTALAGLTVAAPGGLGAASAGPTQPSDDAVAQGQGQIGSPPVLPVGVATARIN